jgi:hypothetical protein
MAAVLDRKQRHQQICLTVAVASYIAEVTSVLPAKGDSQ